MKQRSENANIDPAELWERYLDEIRADRGEPSPQGAMAFAADYFTRATQPAAPAGEPAAWMRIWPDGDKTFSKQKPQELAGHKLMPLYVTPSAMAQSAEGECPTSKPSWPESEPCPICGSLGPWFENPLEGECVARSSAASRHALASAIDSPTVAALENVFNGPGNPKKSYSEQIVEILAHRLTGVAQSSGMREVLGPFAKAADGAASVHHPDDFLIWQELTIGDLRRAKLACSMPSTERASG